MNSKPYTLLNLKKQILKARSNKQQHLSCKRSAGRGQLELTPFDEASWTVSVTGFIRLFIHRSRGYRRSQIVVRLICVFCRFSASVFGLRPKTVPCVFAVLHRSRTVFYRLAARCLLGPGVGFNSGQGTRI